MAVLEEIIQNFKVWKGQKYNALPSENAAKQRNWLFISHICLFIIYLLAFTVAATLNLQNEKFDNSILTPFKQGPSLEVDATWHKLLKCTGI
ncbi:hypothetical protein CJF32_00008224 [Rutstroemia sp. NJR-2017a WRK4]|nr:hypothetical protein CJF32_00008224 [Rutstroemia sp. NJR-2017a WRK4]